MNLSEPAAATSTGSQQIAPTSGCHRQIVGTSTTNLAAVGSEVCSCCFTASVPGVSLVPVVSDNVYHNHNNFATEPNLQCYQICRIGWFMGGGT
jgi:hypothetical protein